MSCDTSTWRSCNTNDALHASFGAAFSIVALMCSAWALGKSRPVGLG
jgi:hypothetical protein